jgi:hypothetical protein
VVDGESPLLVTTFHPQATDPQSVAYVAWIDHMRTQLALYPGLAEPPYGLPRGPAEVPADQRWRLLATFNGGFKYRSGSGGFAVNGRVYTPLQVGLGTLVECADGRVDILDWRAGSRVSDLVLARQNLPLLVEAGRPNPRVGDGLAWGATLGHAAAVWRTGIGVDARGNLIYAAADQQTAASLAAILVRAGAVRAIELDINPEWPTFITYGHRSGLAPSMFVPNPQQRSSRYLTPDSRDFFAVYRRVGSGSIDVPLR